jgi:hypothetical protein
MLATSNSDRIPLTGELVHNALTPLRVICGGRIDDDLVKPYLNSFVFSERNQRRKGYETAKLPVLITFPVPFQRDRNPESSKLKRVAREDAPDSQSHWKPNSVEGQQDGKRTSNP